MIRNLLLSALLLFSLGKAGAQCSVQLAVNSLSCGSSTETNSLIANVSGQGPIQYLWSTGDTTNITDSLDLYTVYHVAITDSTGCTAYDSAAISFNYFTSVMVTNTSCPGCCDGYVTLNTPYVPPTLCPLNSFTFYPGNITTPSLDSVTGLCASAYTITATCMQCMCPTIFTTIMVGTNAVGLSEQQPAEDGLFVFPNPSSEMLNFNTDKIRPGDIVIVYTVEGKELERYTIVPGAQYRTGKLSSGIYTAKVWRDKEPVYTGKLVVKKE
jgi:hypothetical protein